ncbi:MAG: DUF4373 domain-containing protein [Deltaproteobacteria bacterium]|nr:DUF4373 domain-containing protein [Deltaproteobacteria bacterium]
MGRSNKNTVDYFSHYTKHGKTIFILQQRFGNDGYAAWFKLLEVLGSSPGHTYDAGSPEATQYLLAYLNITNEQLEDIMDVLAQMQAISRSLWHNHRVIWSDNFVLGLRDLYEKRKGGMPQKPALMLPETPLSGTSTPQAAYNRGGKQQIRLNNTKVNKKKTPYSAQAMLLSRDLSDNILSHMPNYIHLKEDGGKKEKTLVKWAEVIDLMLRKDKRTHTDIMGVIRWAHQESDFWRTNILSAASLRKQFDRLLAESQKPKKQPFDSQAGEKLADIDRQIKETEKEILYRKDQLPFLKGVSLESAEGAIKTLEGQLLELRKEREQYV